MIVWCRECATTAIELEHSEDVYICWWCQYRDYPQRAVLGPYEGIEHFGDG